MRLFCAQVILIQDTFIELLLDGVRPDSMPSPSVEVISCVYTPAASSLRLSMTVNLAGAGPLVPRLAEGYRYFLKAPFIDSMFLMKRYIYQKHVPESW